jgi:hypothetical protein
MRSAAMMPGSPGKCSSDEVAALVLMVEGEDVEEDLLQRGVGAAVAQRSDDGGQVLADAQTLEEGGGHLRVAEADQPLEGRERDDRLRLGPVVLVGAARVIRRQPQQRLAGVAGLRLFARRVRLEAQRGACGEELQEEGQLRAVGRLRRGAEHLGVLADQQLERRSVGEGRGAARMGAEPVLGPGPAVGFASEQVREFRPASPGEVLDVPVQSAHGESIFPSSSEELCPPTLPCVRKAKRFRSRHALVPRDHGGGGASRSERPSGRRSMRTRALGGRRMTAM